MAVLAPCPGCARHVRASEPSCPFCGAALPIGREPPRVPTQRLGRAAHFAFGAAVATTLNVAGCYASHTRGADAARERDAGVRDAGRARDAGIDAPMDAGGIAPPYGAPPPEEDGGGDVPLYGGPPAD